MKIQLKGYTGILVLSVSMAFCSCVKDIVMDAEEDSQVVVECVLSDEPAQTLRLSYTKGASRDVAPDMPEAVAVLTDLTEGKEAGRFVWTADGSWTLDYAAIAEHRYRLDVTVPGHDPIWAEQTMPSAPDIDVQWDWWRENLPDDAKYKKTHGYVFSADTLRAPVWFYGMNHSEVLTAGEMTERLCTNYPDVDAFNKTESTYSSNNEVSFWGCWFRTSTYPDLDGAKHHSRYLRFPARAGEKTEFLVSGSFRNHMSNPRDFIHSEKRFAELRWFSASVDYDRYLVESWHYAQKDQSPDFADVFLRENVYSNIQGGIGIFGAKVERAVLWDDVQYWGKGMIFLPGLDRIAQQSITTGSGYRNELSTSDTHQPCPFSLLLYEVRDGYPEEWKYGEKGVLAQSFYCVEDESQLREHGIETFGAVDFTAQKVWLVYAAFPVRHLPMLAASLSRDFMTEDGGHYYSSKCIVDYLSEGNVTLHPTSSRIALVVEKINESAYDRVFHQFICGYYDVVLREQESFLDVMCQLGVE